jgi:glyceraldehyde-3-phosphate dehydrogenase/erythrose-4-phosphate dehydrogenase
VDPLIVDGKNIRIKNKKNHAQIGWDKLENLTVVESTGVFIVFHL